MGSAAHRTRRRRPATAAVAVAVAVAAGSLAVAGCSSSAASTPDPSAFRSAFAGIRPRVQSVQSAVSSEVLAAGGPGDPQLADRANALAVATQQSENVVSGLNPPARDNTRLRDVRSALGSVVYDLDNVSTAAGDHDARATAAALGTLRHDAAALTSVEARLSRALGLRATTSPGA